MHIHLIDDLINIRIVFTVLRMRDNKESTCLLRHITTEKWDLCQYAVCITENTTLKKLALCAMYITFFAFRKFSIIQTEF